MSELRVTTFESDEGRNLVLDIVQVAAPAAPAFQDGTRKAFDAAAADKARRALLAMLSNQIDGLLTGTVSEITISLA